MFTGNKLKRSLSLILVLALLLGVSLSFNLGQAKASTFQMIFAPDGRAYYLFVPTSYQAGTPMPLVVMLHGCLQQPYDFAVGTKMNTIAERDGFIVAYPEQQMVDNPNKCWNWPLTWNQVRGSGEPKSIAGVVSHIKSQYTVDSSRVYVAGASAGAAMAVIMGVTYPDVFTAIGVHSGCEYKAATNAFAATLVGTMGGPDPVQQGNIAYTNMGSYARVVPTIVFHGLSDTNLVPLNGHQVLSQWAQTNDKAFDGVDDNDIDDVYEQAVTGFDGKNYTRYVYNNSATGQIVMEKYMVEGLGHAWSGGDPGGSYTDPNAPDASEIMWSFFMNYTK